MLLRITLMTWHCHFERCAVSSYLLPHKLSTINDDVPFWKTLWTYIIIQVYIYEENSNNDFENFLRIIAAYMV